ncbi:MAG: T9SS type A sorting domain-containing protein [Calditrichaeota bacterium]|jgi:hypothetical protein|nr:T9SS type A sorting domain-containing protein [Calditrichota bacterium]MBT7618053.1 T9SS type A sorting domain-containing protein [Calditrichota bacterium]MBT7789384.1 T9SS type A sorting domain-containing protein [Calditrichota bacterium]
MNNMNLFSIRVLILSAFVFAFTFCDLNATEEVKLTSDSTDTGDRFCCSVSISGDYIIIGADCDENDGRNHAGSAYIFFRGDDGWTEQAKLTAIEIGEFDKFGNSVSIDGNYAIVGAYYWYEGQAYIFERNEDGWGEPQELEAMSNHGPEYFGCSVSINGNYAIVGAYRDRDRQDDPITGSASIFVRGEDQWTVQELLTSSDAEQYDNFGYSVSISGDYAIIGAKGNDDDGSVSGSAYIFVRDGENWIEQVKLTASDAAEGDYFGISVFIDGEYAIVGADCNDDGGFNSGSAYIFTLEDDEWVEQTKLTANDASSGDHFGISVSIDEEYATVGSAYTDDNGVQSGSVYIFVRENDEWFQLQELNASDAREGDLFGRSISIDDGRVVVGAVEGDHGEVEDTGAAYFFQDLNERPVIETEIEDVNIDEDPEPRRVEIAVLDEIFIDANEENADSLMFSVCDSIPVELNLSIDDENILFFEPDSNFNLADGIEIQVFATDTEDSFVSESFNLSINPINDYPRNFDLLAPENGYDQIDREDFEITFEWTEAENVDADTISYSFILNVVYDEIDETITHAGIEAPMFVFNDLRTVLSEHGVFSEDTLDFVATWWVEAYDAELTTESNERRALTIPVPVSVGSISGEMPFKFSLNPAFPNPFNANTEISYSLPLDCRVSLQVYNISGQLIETIVDLEQKTGTYQVILNGNKIQTSGVYIIYLSTDLYQDLTKIMYVK